MFGFDGGVGARGDCEDGSSSGVGGCSPESALSEALRAGWPGGWWPVAATAPKLPAAACTSTLPPTPTPTPTPASGGAFVLSAGRVRLACWSVAWAPACGRAM
jgi:hypothetical protein